MLRKINNEKGSTLLLVILGFFIVSIITMTGIFISNAGSKRTVKEEHRTKAYYVAQTGAKTFINHLEKEAKAGKDILKELKELDGITSKPTPYELTKDGNDYGEFVIKVEGIKSDHKNDKDKIKSYKIITKGTVKTQEVKLVAIVNPQFDGGGYETRNGRIFSNSNIPIAIEKVPQLKGAGINIYMLSEKYGDKVPISINKPDKVSELFISISDRISKLKGPNKSNIEALNSQDGGPYRLEIIEPADKSTKIEKENPIKSDKLVKYKNNGEKDEKFEEIYFTYGTDKKDLLNYFAKGKLTGEPMSDAQIEEGLKSVFLLPITTKEEYLDYIKPTSVENPIYPKSPEYKPAKYTETIEDLVSGDPLDTQKSITILKDENLLLKGGLHIKEKGQLTINAKGDCNIKIDGDFVIANPTGSFLKIHADGKVNIYIDGKMDINGIIEVSGNGEVNVYMYEGEGVELNNSTDIKNMNIYCPNAKIALYDVKYEGVIVGEKVDFNNDESTFKAPSSGPASKSEQTLSDIDIEWQN